MEKCLRNSKIISKSLNKRSKAARGDSKRFAKTSLTKNNKQRIKSRSNLIFELFRKP